LCSVTPANPSIAKGLTQQFTATGTYSDASTQNITSTLTWASATTSVATITSGAEREDAYRLWITAMPHVAGHQDQAGRQIPIVLVSPG